MEMLMVLLSSLLTSLPVLLVDVALLVIAVSRWNRHPRVSMLAAFSGGLMLLLDLLGRAFFTMLPIKLRDSGGSAADTGIVFAIAGGISSLLHAVALGVLVAAVFAERPTTSPPQGLASFSGR